MWPMVEGLGYFDCIKAYENHKNQHYTIVSLCDTNCDNKYFLNKFSK